MYKCTKCQNSSALHEKLCRIYTYREQTYKNVKRKKVKGKLEEIIFYTYGKEIKTEKHYCKKCFKTEEKLNVVKK